MYFNTSTVLTSFATVAFIVTMFSVTYHIFNTCFNDKQPTTFIGKHLDDVVKTLDPQKYRIAEKDGENYILTKDYHVDRINFHVANNIITHYWYG